MLDLISEEELNKKRSYKDIDKDNGERLRELIEDKFLNQIELAEYFNCCTDTIRQKIKKYNLNYRKKSNKQFKYEVNKLVGDEYTVLGEYINSDIKIKIKHNKCGNIYNTKPINFLKGRRCPKCCWNAQKTTNKFKKEVYKLVGDEYTVLGEYINSDIKIKMKHNKCGYLYTIEPTNFLQGTRCAKCAGNAKKTTEEFKKEVYELVGGEYTVLGEYNNCQTEIKIKHNECGHIYKIKPSSFLIGTICPKCRWNGRKTTEEFKKEVYELVGDEYTVLGEYASNKTKIKMRHNKCGHIYKVKPQKFLQGSRCPICSLASKSELKIFNWLNDKNYNFKYNYTNHKCEDKRKLRFDFYLDNLIIEYDGLQHFKKEDFFRTNLKIRRRRDNIKNQYCKENDIRLIRIPYWQKDNIENILESIFINEELNQRWSLKEYWSENKDIDYLVVC
jgi:hypothetical protein